MQKRNLSKTNWWQKFFQKEYLEWWEDRMGLLEKDGEEVKFLKDVLKLKKKDRILDLCCGQGRHSILLAKKGYDVTGLDYSKYLLDKAKERAKREKVKINFIRKNAKEINFEEEFDVVINIFTSFGYENDRENEKIIKNIAKALKKGGRFLIDFTNAVWILQNYKREIWLKTKYGIMLNENSLDIKNFTNITKVTFFLKEGREKRYKWQIRMYAYPEMRDLLKKHGLIIKKVYGSFEKEKFDTNSKRMIILAKKK